MDKYIIDGVEYSYGEEVEVSMDCKKWFKRVLIGYIQNAVLTPYITNGLDDDKLKYLWIHIRKIQPTLSGRKAKLILEDGTEYSVTVG